MRDDKRSNLTLARTGGACWLSLLAASIPIMSCGHEAPFAVDRTSPAGPFSQSFPRRITFNTGDDRTPTWLPDGSGIMYSSERIDRFDHDRCLTVIPPEGGTIIQRYCPTDPVEDDSTNLMESPAVSSDGSIFFHQVTSWVGQQKLGESSLRLGRVNDPVSSRQLTLVPYLAPTGTIHSSIRSPVWTGTNTVVYLAEQLFYQGSTFYPDTFFTGLDIVRLDVSGNPPVFEVIPGTHFASSFAVTDEADILYYTLGGDSRVYRQDLASGVVTVLYDFGSGNIARDVAISGSKLAAVVGRSVLYQFEAPHDGYVQRDEGGDLHLVDLPTASEDSFTTDSVLFRHPVFSPDGHRLVVEVTPFAPVHVGPSSDYNATNHRADLWLFDVPSF
ncbi:MAG: hypothetical protein ABI679_10515 [Gemmatimonadota bacterium]